MKKFLQDLIKQKTAQMEALRKKSDASESIDEVRAIGETLATLKKEIEDAEKMLAELDKEEEPPAGEEGASEGERGFNPIATYGGIEKRGEVDDDDPTNTIEYRMAFKNFVMTGEKAQVLEDVRNNENTLTTDVGSVIPTVVVNRIVEKIESTGMILPLITRTNYAAGVEIPTSSLKPTASWVNEGAGSERQKKTTSKISFTHHKLRCEVSISMEVGTMALSAFEAKLVENVAEAMVKAIEQAIISGNGMGKPKGILAETPETGQAITLTSGTDLSYDLLTNAEGVLPQAYENVAVWCMTKKTFMMFMGMVDDNGQPIARINQGVDGKSERTLLGRTVECCGDYMSNYAKTPSANTIFAFLFNFKDYALNTINDMVISKKQDWDTEDLLTKAVTTCDGKVVDKRSLVTLTINA